MTNEQPPWICSSCGHTARNVQIRIVCIDAGGGTLLAQGIAPVNSCVQCGAQQVDYKINIGELVQLGQAPAPKASPPVPTIDPGIGGGDGLSVAPTKPPSPVKPMIPRSPPSHRSLRKKQVIKKKASKKKSRRKR